MQNENLIFWLTLAAFCGAYYAAAGLAINVAYHRALAHRALRLRKTFERFFVVLGLPAGTPVQWVGNHRFHHRRADAAGDPHSPVRDGFWHAHVGWYIGSKNPSVCFLYAIAGPLRTLFDGWHRPRTNREHDHLAADIAKDGFYRFLSRPLPFLLACWLHVFAGFGAAYLIWGAAGALALWLTLALIYNLGDAIDSVAHLYGSRPFAAAHHARNNPFLGIFALGEGWHANHHVFPSSARHGLFARQFDAAWQIIRLFEKLRIASDVRTPSADQIEAKLLKDESARNRL